MPTTSHHAVLKTNILIALSAALLTPAFGQPPPVTCLASIPAPTIVRIPGETEYLGDLVLTCTGGTPTPMGQPVPLVNFTIFASVGLTSNITDTTVSPAASEALVLIDEPAPSALMAGTNLFQGAVPAACTSPCNSMNFLGIPFDPPGSGTRILRLTNLRADASVLPANSQIQVDVVANGPIALNIQNPVQVAATTQDAFSYTAVPAGKDISVTITEAYPAAFRKRLETNGMLPQDIIPMQNYCTESGLTYYPFSMLTPANNTIPGNANSATRFLIRVTNVTGSGYYWVPASVMDASGSGMSLRQFKGYDSFYAAGTPVVGFFLVTPVSGTLEFVYEVTGGPGVTGCGVNENYPLTINHVAFDSLAGATAVVKIAPIDAANYMSQTDPEPRFKP